MDEFLLQGEPAAAILDFAQKEEGIVAMTTHGRSGIGRWLLGSVADKVMRACGVPVLLVRCTEEDVSGRPEAI